MTLLQRDAKGTSEREKQHTTCKSRYKVLQGPSDTPIQGDNEYEYMIEIDKSRVYVQYLLAGNGKLQLGD